MQDPVIYLVLQHAQHERGKVIGVGVHMYICIYVCVFVGQIFFNRTLAIDSPFQIFAVEFPVKFID